ncbi:MAG TPA: 4'-phosphopantetheinyl transferase superfamily protein [Thermoanaerobaculia bacterium]|nr:4'-phosphopantetheinyl transferase superfamily protein [Thermoanaerobaculia bacterium]
MALSVDEVRVWFAEAKRREHTAAGRALLRHVLGEVEVERGEGGKPRLASGELHFNISHSGELVAVAIAMEPVGIDVEEIRPTRELLAIARRFFSAEEARRVEQDADQFFRVWTAKEAIVKAIGSGVFDNLRSFTVPEDATEPAIVQGREGWVVCAIEPPREGYRAAVAMPAGRRWRISCAPCASLDSWSG